MLRILALPYCRGGHPGGAWGCRAPPPNLFFANEHPHQNLSTPTKFFWSQQKLNQNLIAKFLVGGSVFGGGGGAQPRKLKIYGKNSEIFRAAPPAPQVFPIFVGGLGLSPQAGADINRCAAPQRFLLWRGRQWQTLHGAIRSTAPVNFFWALVRDEGQKFVWGASWKEQKFLWKGGRKFRKNPYYLVLDRSQKGSIISFL